jgi:hypothetical protein
MPRFRFNIRKGDSLVPDREGMELVDLEAARDEARNTALDIIMDQARKGEGTAGQKVEIEDEDGKIVEIIEIRDFMH